jgi:hypothetical protein
MAGQSKPHRERVPEPLEVIVGRLGELRVLFGTAGAATTAAVDEDLRQALWARDRGDHPEAVRLITRGMDRLVQLATTLDAEAAAAMRVVIDRFRSALAQGCEEDARRAADALGEMSGAKRITKGQP